MPVDLNSIKSVWDRNYGELGDIHVALANLFEHLMYLEHLAVRMCERFELVEGQLEDELRHRKLFAIASGEFDTGDTDLKLDPADAIEPIRDLIQWTESLNGEAAYLVLNIVAEHWLEVILGYLNGPVGPEYTPMIAEIERDERRHCAPRPALPEGWDPAPYVHTLEEHLHAIASDPRFMWPLSYILGHELTVNMAQEIHAGHEELLRYLNVFSSDHFVSLLACRREAETLVEPKPIGLDVWRQSAFNLDLAPMTGFRRIPWPWSQDPLEVEARVVRAVHRTLRACPHLNLTINLARRELHRPAEPIVGVRRQGHPGVVTAYTRAHEDLAVMSRDIRAKARQARTVATPWPKFTNLKFRPPSHVPAVVTSLMGAGGITVGLAPLTDAEGAIWSVGVPGEFTESGHLMIGVLADHRAVDGKELCEFLAQLEHNLKD